MSFILSKQEQEWLEGVIERTAKAVIDEHWKNCPIGNIVVEVWGVPGDPEKPGLKGHVAELRGDVKALKTCKKFMGDLVKPSLVAVIVAALMWGMQHYQKSDNGGSSPPPTQGARP